MLEPVLAATSELDVTVAYTNTPRPFDADGLRELGSEQGESVIASEQGASLIVVEPYLEGTSAHVVSRALATVPHRLLSLGVGRNDLHRYGTPADHSTAHGLDPAGLRRSIAAFLR
jgi:transketolase